MSEHTPDLDSPIDGDVLCGALRRLATLGVTSLILEGGPALHASAWQARLVDRVQMYVGQASAGPDGVRWLDRALFETSALTRLRMRWLGADLLIEGDVHRNH